jgi:hypothetical protein
MFYYDDFLSIPAGRLTAFGEMPSSAACVELGLMSITFYDIFLRLI